jgi:cytochrome c oxidase cbb3-type subunit 3
MRAVQQSILSAAAGTALALFAFGCGEQSDAPAPPKQAERAPAAPPAKPPSPPQAPPAAAETPDTPPPRGALVQADAEAGKADYRIYCASCHGESGAADGPIAQTLNPKPARHNDGAYMNALTDDYLFKVVKFGGASVGKSSMMAALGGSLSDQQIHNIVAFVRTLADPPYQP